MSSAAPSDSHHISYAPAEPHRAPAGRRAVSVAEPDAARGHRLSRSYPTEASFLEADALAVSLKGAVDRITAPLASSAAALRRRRGWVVFGYARLDDYARERIGCTGRWLRELAALGDKLGGLPGLEAALTGDDGGKPLGRFVAMQIAKVACRESLGAWVELARRVGSRQLSETVGRARTARSAWPVDVGGQAELTVDADADEDGCFLKWPMPAPVAAAFDEVVDLYRCLEGHESTVAGFTEALAAEAAAGPAGVGVEIDINDLNHVEGRARIEKAHAHSTENWGHLPAAGQVDWALALAGASLAQLAQLRQCAGEGDAVALDDQIRQLVGLEQELDRRLGEILARLADQDAWARLRFDSTGHYAEQRLGLSRTALEDRARVARALRRLPVVRDAYETGEIRFASVLGIVRAVGKGVAEESLQQAWVQRAREASVKRIRDEVKAIHRTTALAGGSGEGVSPLEDSTWRASIRREVGTATRRVAHLGELAASSLVSDVFLRLRLPKDNATRLVSAVESARIRLARLVEAIPWDEAWPDAKAPASVRAAREFFVRCRRIPAWVGLLALLEDFVATWDVGPKRRGDEVYVRAGWRCTAPGCTSRRYLEDHHLHPRARGGSDELWNRDCLCRFHHAFAAHGGLGSCEGRAPLEVTWRLGRIDVGTWWVNERRQA